MNEQSNEKALKVVILDTQGQISVYANSLIEMDITLQEIIDTIKADRPLNGDYEIYICAKDLTQSLNNLRIPAKDIRAIAILPKEMEKRKLQLRS